MVDLLYVAAGTTAGLQRSDAAFVAAAQKLGLEIVTVSSTFSLPWRLRKIVWRSLLAIDTFEAASLALATRRALRAYEPRAIVYGTSHAALLQFQAHRRPTAIRFDTPAQLSRRGARFGPEHVLERRRFKAARVLLPWGVDVDAAVSAYVPDGTAAVPLPIPISGTDSVPASSRDRLVLAYAANPEKKGLALITQAWSQAQPHGYRLLITGLDEAAARSFLNTVGLDLPVGTEYAGKVSASEHRALTRRAAVYLAASRYEDYGIAQLEALADGALLVTTRSDGPYAALTLAQQLDPRLVAARAEPDALAGALAVGLAYSDPERRLYQQRAAAMMQSHTTAELAARLRELVFPALLDTARG